MTNNTHYSVTCNGKRVSKRLFRLTTMGHPTIFDCNRNGLVIDFSSWYHTNFILADRNNFTCGSNAIVNCGHLNVIDVGNNSKVIAHDGNTIICGDYCDVIAKENNTIICGKGCSIKAGVGSIVKAGKDCDIEIDPASVLVSEISTYCKSGSNNVLINASSMDVLCPQNELNRIEFVGNDIRNGGFKDLPIPKIYTVEIDGEQVELSEDSYNKLIKSLTKD